MEVFAGSQYNHESENQTILLDISTDPADMLNTTDFLVKLKDKLILDEEYEIYFESITTFRTNVNTDINDVGFLLKFFDLNIQNGFTTSNTKLENKKILIPNSCTTDGATVVSKGKKLNFICSILPARISEIHLSLTNLNGESIFTANDGRAIIELLCIPKKKKLSEKEKLDLALYEHTSYFDYRNKNLIIDLESTTASNDAPFLTHFSVDLVEPMIIDRQSEIYLDSKIINSSNDKDNINNMGILLNVNEFDINNRNNNSNSNLSSNKVLIPNENLVSGTEDSNSMTNVFTLNYHRFGASFGDPIGVDGEDDEIIDTNLRSELEHGTTIIYFWKHDNDNNPLNGDGALVPVSITGYDADSTYLNTTNATRTISDENTIINRIHGPQHSTSAGTPGNASDIALSWHTVTFEINGVQNGQKGKILLINYSWSDYKSDFATDLLKQFNSAGSSSDNLITALYEYSDNEASTADWKSSPRTRFSTVNGGTLRPHETINESQFSFIGGGIGNSITTRDVFESNLAYLYIDPDSSDNISNTFGNVTTTDGSQGWHRSRENAPSVGTGPNGASNGSETNYYFYVESSVSQTDHQHFETCAITSPLLTIQAYDILINIQKPLKANKYNYISTINPKIINNISGNISNLNNQTIVSSQDSRVVMNFLIKPCL